MTVQAAEYLRRVESLIDVFSPLHIFNTLLLKQVNYTHGFMQTIIFVFYYRKAFRF